MARTRLPVRRLGNVALEWHYKGKPWEAAENYRRGSPLEALATEIARGKRSRKKRG